MLHYHMRTNRGRTRQTPVRQGEIIIQEEEKMAEELGKKSKRKEKEDKREEKMSVEGTRRR